MTTLVKLPHLITATPFLADLSPWYVFHNHSIAYLFHLGISSMNISVCIYKTYIFSKIITTAIITPKGTAFIPPSHQIYSEPASSSVS